MVELQSINVETAVGDHLVCGRALLTEQGLRVWFYLIWYQDPGLSSKYIFCILQFCKGKDLMAQGGFNGIHFSFKSEELSRKNSSNSKVKADVCGKSRAD